jgi:hypothetical protein
MHSWSALATLGRCDRLSRLAHSLVRPYIAPMSRAPSVVRLSKNRFSFALQIVCIASIVKMDELVICFALLGLSL